MKPNQLVIGISSAALLGTGVAWLALPWLQSANQSLDSQAAVHVERARRLLQSYSFGLTHSAVLHDDLAASGVDLSNPAALSETSADQYQKDHEARWKAYRPTDWSSDPPQPVRASYGNLPTQIRDGMHARKEMTTRNDQLLDQASTSVDEALALTDGEASARTHVEANRLRGVILYHRGLAQSLRAATMRQQAMPHRRELVRLAAIVDQNEAARSLVTASGVDGQIQNLRKQSTEDESRVKELRDRLAALDSTLQNLEQRWSAAKAKEKSSRDALDALRTRGMDLSAPQGGAAFETRLMELDKSCRDAAREVLSLEFGAYPAAAIDLADNYLEGQYLSTKPGGGELDIEHGLTYYRADREVLASQVRFAARALEDLASDIARQEALKTSLLADQDRAVQRIKETCAAATDVFDNLNRAESEAFAVEEKALDMLDKSAKASQAAAGYAKQWVSDARSRSQELSPEAKERSADKLRVEDGWMSGHIAAQTADARLERAWIHYGRYSAYTQSAAILADAAAKLQLKEAEDGAQREKATQAREECASEVTQAMALLEPAHREARNHWTFVAQEAGAADLLALLGESSYAAAALDAYRNAVKGREKEPYARQLVARLQRLESR